MRKIISKIFQTAQVYAETVAHIERVIAAGGTVEDRTFLNQFIANAKANGYFNDIVAAWCPSWGVKGTLTASDLFSLTGAGQDIDQAVGASQPDINIADLNGRTRLCFDGINDFMESAAFTFNQPETIIYGGLRQRVFGGKAFADGLNANSMAFLHSVSTPDVRLFASSFTDDNSDLLVGSDFHCRTLFNNASSAIQINQSTATVGNCGAANGGGFTLGALGNGTAPAPIDIGMVILLNAAVDANYAAKMLALYNFSKSAYGTT